VSPSSLSIPHSMIAIPQREKGEGHTGKQALKKKKLMKQNEEVKVLNGGEAPTHGHTLSSVIRWSRVRLVMGQSSAVSRE